MTVKEFYNRACVQKGFYKEVSGTKVQEVFSNAFYELCQNLSSMDGKAALEKAKERLESGYLNDYFQLSWLREQTIQDDMAKLTRFINWLNGAKVIATNVDATVRFSNGNLTTKVALIVLSNGKPAAVNVSFGKAKSSFNGKSIHTNAYYDLYALVAKAGLEKAYQGIVVYNVYLTNDDDKVGCIAPKFTINQTKKSNVFYYDFNAFYEAGRLNGKELVNSIVKVLKEPLNKNCYGCRYSDLCATQPMKSLVVDSVPVYDEDVCQNKSIDFTSSQKKVIETLNGAVRVIAGPGSGKTATLVGRIRRMIEEGIEPEFILAITFSREAAGELKKRCAGFCTDMPKISTIHALCYEILRQNADLLGKEVKLLAKKDRLDVIEGCLEVLPVSGITSGDDMPKTVEKLLDKYFTKFGGDADAFLSTERSLGKDFIEFASMYDNLCKEKGYISFTDQIVKCIELLKAYPDVLAIYSNMYKYIMVDEFQDIDESQWEFIRALASHGNICVVGDDDQNIYTFRGGSNKYMLEFDKYYPAAVTVTLKENFRSTTNLVNAAQNIIAFNKARLDKEVVSGRKGDNGVGPICVNDMSTGMIEKIVASMVKKGISYKDIAILATKNATLETLHESLSIPTILDKTVLIRSALFGVIYDVLCLYYSDNNASDRFYHLARLFGETEVIPEYRGKNSLYAYVLSKYGYPLNMDSEFYNTAPEDNGYIKSIKLLKTVSILLADANIAPAFFVQSIAYAVEQEESPALGQIAGLIAENNITTVEELHNTLSYMVRYEDDTRVDVSNIESVHLITNHDSKGREFTAVIMVDDFASEINEENRRLAYVGMTRAKDLLYVLSDKNDTIISELKVS